MIHPHTRLVYINDEIGYGVFATEFIPKGTITYVKDTLELELTTEEFMTHKEELRNAIDKYSYIDESGKRIVSWDLGKYVNHCCHCNSMSTGYGFEIAIRDIQPGEELTDEYGLFNITEPMNLHCKWGDCRGIVSREGVDKYYEQWDEILKSALSCMANVEQPLSALLDEETVEAIDRFQKDPSEYKSVKSLKFNTEKSNGKMKNAASKS